MSEVKTMMSSRVRIVLRRNFREMPVDIMRGVVTDNSATGITISGRHFQEIRDNLSGTYEERPLTSHSKVYFIPYGSVKYVDIIIPGSPEAKNADVIETKPKTETPVKEYTFSIKR